VLYGRLPLGANLAFHLAFIIATSVAASTRRPWYHQTLGPIALGLYVLYSVMLFGLL
jgi:hypothetical protein